MRETWYLLEDGRKVDPNEVAHDDGGVLRHASGVAVAMRGQVPHSIGVDPDEERAKADAGSGKDTSQGKSMKPEKKKPGYNTRESKAD